MIRQLHSLSPDCQIRRLDLAIQPERRWAAISLDERRGKTPQWRGFCYTRVPGAAGNSCLPESGILFESASEDSWFSFAQAPAHKGLGYSFRHSLSASG